MRSCFPLASAPPQVLFRLDFSLETSLLVPAKLRPPLPPEGGAKRENRTGGSQSHSTTTPPTMIDSVSPGQ